MNIRDLQYLVAVADTQHFGRAAERSFVSQPTLSAQLKKLEEELGVQLIERNNKRVRVTKEGEAIVAQARVVLSEIEHLKALAQHSQDPLAGTFHLGIIPTLGPYLLPHILPAFKKQLPNLQLIVQENKTENIVSALKEGELDAIILALPIESTGLEGKELFCEPFYIALPTEHLLNKKKKLSLQDLKEETLLLLDEGHCLREQALEACQFARGKKTPGFQATSLETLRHLVAAGDGVTLLPGLSVSSAEKDSAIRIKMFANPVPSRQVGLLWRKSTSRRVCCEKIAELVTNAVRGNSHLKTRAILTVMKKEL